MNRLSRWFVRSWPFPFGIETLVETFGDDHQPTGLARTSLRDNPSVVLEHRSESYLGKLLALRGSFEEAITRTILRELKHGSTFVDVGANVGYYTTLASRQVGSSGRVIAFEPQESVLAILRRNVEHNECRNVTVVPRAVGASKGTATLWEVSATNDGQATLSLRDGETGRALDASVEVTTLAAELNSLAVSSIDVLKVDVEGGEFGVLSGADLVGSLAPRVMLLEVIDEYLARFGSTAADLVEMLRNSGYDVFRLRLGSWAREDHAIPSGYRADVMAVRRTSVASRGR